MVKYYFLSFSFFAYQSDHIEILLLYLTQSHDMTKLRHNLIGLCKFYISSLLSFEFFFFKSWFMSLKEGEGRLKNNYSKLSFIFCFSFYLVPHSWYTYQLCHLRERLFLLEIIDIIEEVRIGDYYSKTHVSHLVLLPINSLATLLVFSTEANSLHSFATLYCFHILNVWLTISEMLLACIICACIFIAPRLFPD